MDFSLVPPDPEFRRRLLEEARSKGARALHEWLAEVDPAAAARIHPNDQKRIIRALEVAESTGGAGSGSGKVDRERPPRYNSTQFGLTLEREELYRRIEARVDRMIAGGLVEEVRGLLERGLGEDLTSMKGLGYAQIAPHVRGQFSLEEAVSRLKRDTRRFAKRQMTWFRADPRIEWIDVGEAGGAAAVVEAVRGKWQ
jgi:tRNA dimethylallyltransferase